MAFRFDVEPDVAPAITAELWAAALARFGCAQCETISLTGVHVCEHGVTVAEPVVAEMSVIIRTPEDVRRFLGLPPRRPPT